jgi:hypothetical protein
LTIRPKKANEVLKDQLVIVHYFTEGTGKNASPSPAKLDYCRLETLDSEGVSLKFPGLRTRKSTGRYYYSWRYRNRYKRGSELSGIIVSVFDGDGGLTFQMTSSPKLRTRGGTAVSDAEEIRKEL